MKEVKEVDAEHHCVRRNALLGDTAPGRTGSSIDGEYSTPHSPFGHVARLGGWVNTRGLRPPSVRPHQRDRSFIDNQEVTGGTEVRAMGCCPV